MGDFVLFGQTAAETARETVDLSKQAVGEAVGEAVGVAVIMAMAILALLVPLLLVMLVIGYVSRSGNKSRADKGAMYFMNGVQDLLEVYEDRVAITPKGVLGFLNKGLKGTKEIPFASIYAIQFKEAGNLTSGFLQFTIPGGNESRGGLFAAAQDENTFMFTKINNILAKEIKDYIDGAVRKSRAAQAPTFATNLSDELQKLAQLKAQGILSEEEFQAAKKKLIG